MSKAFVKESDGDDEEEGNEPTLALPVGTKNYMTPRCHSKLKEELRHLMFEDRPEVVKVVQWAAGNGDRSENGDYIYGKKRLREIDRRIRFLNRRLDAAEVIDPAQQKSDRVLFGATVTIEDEEGRLRQYKIVGLDETNPAQGEISWRSPIGAGLLNLKAGDSVTLRMPKGDEEITVVKIQYLPIL